MTEEQTLYVAQTLLASAFYYGFAGGLVGCAVVFGVRFVCRRFFGWR